jgi:hypothetical protein
VTQPIPPRNLISGQYQIGNLIFGRGTTVRVETFDIKPYDVNPQDHQVSLSDEIRFGIDSFKPTTIEITFHVLSNRLLPGYEYLIPNFWQDMPKAADFQKEWRFDEGRKVWGAIKPLYACGKDDVTRMIYGRPRQFTYAKDSDYTESVNCLGQFQRSDTLAYTAQESYIELAGGVLPWHLTRTGGDSDTWFRILAYGPMTNPKFTVGIHTIDLDYEIAEGEALEISSYPWMRRAVDSNRTNLAAYLIGRSEYLDRMTLPWAQDVPIRWTSEELNTWVPDLGNQTWEQDISSLKFGPLPSYFTTLNGKARVRFDLINSIQFGLPIITPSKFIGNAILGHTTSIIDNQHQFATGDQYSEARVTEPFDGRSAIVIMSNSTMTNYGMVEVSSGLLNNKLKIRLGTSPTDYGPVVAEWSRGLGWDEHDRVGIGYEEDTSRFVLYYNREEVGSWVDTTHIVDQANRHQGYIFDMDGNLLSQGTGFRDLVSYDRAGGIPPPFVPGEYPPGPPPPGSPIGRAFLFWHDAWSTIV